MPATLVRSAINGAQGRRRAATYPPRARDSDASDPDGDMMAGGRRAEGHDDASRDRVAEEGRGGHARRHASSSLGCERKRSASLAKRNTRTDYKLTFPSPHQNSQDNDNLRSSTSLPWLGYKEDGGGSGDTGTSRSSREAARESRRRSRRSATPGGRLSGSGVWDDMTSPAAKQHILVKVMFGLVMVLTSVHILTLVVHPPREITGGLAARDRLLVAATSQMTSNSAVGVASPLGSNRRMTSGVGPYGGNPLVRGAAETRHRAESLVLQDREQHSGTVVSRDFVEGQERGAIGSTGGDRHVRGAQGNAFSLTDPRAFEMVAADMGNLKDTVEKLDRAFRDTMSQQGKDLAAVMEELGLQSVRDARLTAQAAPPPRPGGLVPAFFFDKAQQQMNEVIPAQFQVGIRGGGKDGAIKGLVAGGASGASSVRVKPSAGSENPKITSAKDSITDSRNTSHIMNESQKHNEPAGAEKSKPTLSALAVGRTSGIPLPSAADKLESIAGTKAKLENRKKAGDKGIRPGEEQTRPGTRAGGRDTGGDGPGEKKPGHGGGGLAESTRLDTVWNAYSQGRWVNGQWVPKVLLDDTAPDLTLPPERKQKRVLLLSERRSGAQAIGRVLNADPRAFYIGDPCRMGGGPEALDGRMCATVVSRLLACQPTINDVRNLFSFSYLVERSRALSEFEQLRWHAGGTPEDNDELVRQWLSRDCRLSKVVIVKETRLPELTPQLLAPGLDPEFLYVVRDPRAAVHGLAEVWKTSKNSYEQANAKDCTELAAKFCSLTQKKIDGLTRLGKERVHILKYEMVIEDPIAMMQGIYGWLGLIPVEVNDTIMRIGTVPRGATNLQGGDEMQSERGTANVAAFERATRWTTEMPAFRRQQVQAACEPLLVALGYDGPTSYD